MAVRTVVRALAAAVGGVLLASLVAPASSSAAAPPALPTIAAPLQPAATIDGAPPVSGTIRAPGGPYLVDGDGRVVIFHGVNVVYKHSPFEVYPDRGKPWNFDAADASLMARLGFNVVRLGMTWSGLEPGRAPSNDPAICQHGEPGDPDQFDRAVLSRYLTRLAETVNLLGRYHIYTILDMHQDVYNEMFDGEGAPDWAVCTNGVPSVDPPGRWSLEYATRAAGIAFHNFWANDVVGDLQGQFDMVWGDVARYFRNNRWVLGYDPFNEPFSTSLVTRGGEHFDSQLECFYTGRGHVGGTIHGAPPITCPRHDPSQGLIPTILSNDPYHLIFDEPDNFASRGYPTFLGSMDFPNLVYNVHVYCGDRSPMTGNPENLQVCADQDVASLVRRANDRAAMASAIQRAGPAWFVTEFGATSNTGLLTAVTDYADAENVGWAYWAWKYYDDPTGSGSEALLRTTGRLRSTARVLSRTYPEAIAGTPRSMSFSPLTARFRLTYRPSHGVRAPTVVFVPTSIHYPHGYCARAVGATVTSAPGSELLQVVNARIGETVTVTVAPGRCHGPGRG